MVLEVTPGSKAEISEIIQAFLVDIEYKLPPLQIDRGIDHEVKSHFKDNGFSEEFIFKIETQIKPGVGLATTAFRSTPFEIQCTVAIFTTYCLIIDDFARDPEFRHHLKQFNVCLLARHPQDNPVLQSMAEFMRSFYPLFGQFSTDMIIKDSLQFISACYVEAENEKLCFPAEARQFPYYFRLKVGVAEAYSFMLFPIAQFSELECLKHCLPIIPYLIRAFNGVNDIMSFYKELAEMEKCNFIANSALCKDTNQMEFMRKLCDRLVQVIRTLRTLGRVHLGVSEAIESFIQGYVAYHLVQTRYRMEDLDMRIVLETREKCCTSTISKE